MKIQQYELKLCRKFQEGDIICHKRNMDVGFLMFATATDYDVCNYSGKNGYYYKLVKR